MSGTDSVVSHTSMSGESGVQLETVTSVSTPDALLATKTALEDYSRSIDARIQEAQTRLEEQSDQKLAKKQAAALAGLIALLPELYERRQLPLLYNAYHAAAALSHGNTDLGQSILNDLKRRFGSSIRKAVGRAMKGEQEPTVALMLGLGVLFYGVLLVGYLIFTAVTIFALDRVLGQERLTLLGVPVVEVATVAVAGALGSIVSMFIRIQDFSLPSNVTSVTFFWTGMLKPIVGASFALFLWAIYQSGLLANTFVAPSGRETYVLFALAFVAGFSERLARDVAGRAERVLAPREEAPSVSVTSKSTPEPKHTP